MTTSVEEHDPLVIVHLRVALVPAGIPVTVVVGDTVFVIVAVPASTVHKPVPGAAELAAIVNVAALQSVSSAPARAAGGATLFVRTSSSALVHEPFVIVQRKVTELPSLKPVTVLVAEAGVVIVAPFDGPIILHEPRPTPGVFAFKVKSPSPHLS